ncbi:NERD domain-containing protein [Alkaliphilus hydrothermalis]|nr:NERD domain-containing protein [Alkaliphilus hydrothermalis]
MIPPYIHKDVKSAAEKNLFNKIRNDNYLDDWICFHSLGLAKHTTKTEGEVDFLLVGKEGIFSLEVKGGDVKRKDGLWHFTNRYGLINKKSEGPFKQVSQAHFSLMKNLSNRFPGITNECLFGYGVLFPDIPFKYVSVEWDNHIIYDKDDRLKPFAQYLRRLINHWREKHPQKGYLHKSRISEVINYLRGDFELIKPLNITMDDNEELFIKFTEEQYKALDRMEYNSRVFFRGTAGTGKTLLAAEKARRLGTSGKKVLMLCFNKILAGKLKATFLSNSDYSNVKVDSIHKYFQSVIVNSIICEEFKYVKQEILENEFYKVLYPDYFVRALNDVSEEYDYLIIDEGQDFLCYEYIMALDYVIKGGFENGSWAIFYDPNKQADMFGNFDEGLANSLRNFGAAEYVLDFNCRNTKNIADAASMMSGYDIEETRVKTGEAVKYSFYKNKSDQITILADTIKSLKSKGVEYHDITILYPSPEMENSIIKGLNINHKPEKITYDNAANLSKGIVSYSSVQAYKGMENKIIILIGIEELDNDWISSVNYVAMTRAKQMLIILLNKNLEEVVQVKILDLLQRGRLVD